jgi:hypothetical protein
MPLVRSRSPHGTKIKYDKLAARDNVNSIKKNTEDVTDASKEDGLEVNVEKTVPKIMVVMKSPAAVANQRVRCCRCDRWEHLQCNCPSNSQRHQDPAYQEAF